MRVVVSHKKKEQKAFSLREINAGTIVRVTSHSEFIPNPYYLVVMENGKHKRLVHLPFGYLQKDETAIGQDQGIMVFPVDAELSVQEDD